MKVYSPLNGKDHITMTATKEESYRLVMEKYKRKTREIKNEMHSGAKLNR